MEKTKDDMAFIKQTFDSIVDYEKSWMKSPHNNVPTPVIPVNKILDYFGVENICKLFGCTIFDEDIARRLIIKSFE